MGVKNARKIGFVTALAVLLGSVIGVGIFFKNNSVAKAVSYEGITWIAAWVLGGVLSLAAAISFSKIGIYKHPKLAGFSSWTYRAGGKKFGYFSRFNYGFFYFGIYISVFGTFASETLFNFFKQTGAIKEVYSVPLYGHVLIGFGFTVFFVALNFISLRVAGYFQIVSTVLKFIPLIVAIFVGIIFANTYNNPESRKIINGAYAVKDSAFQNKDFRIAGLFAALPAVLFAYDSFLAAGPLTHKTKGGEITISKVVIFGMSTVVILYTLIAISSSLHNQGTITGLIEDSLPKKSAKGLKIFVSIFLFVSTMGVTNGMTTTFVNEIENNVLVGSYFKSISLREKIGVKKTSIIYGSIFILFWSIIVYIPALATNSDSLVDGFSNFPTFFFFVLYALTILFHYFNVYKKQENKNILFVIASWVAVIGISISMLAFFIFLGIDAFKELINKTSIKDSKNNWGFLIDGKNNGFYIPRWLETIFFVIGIGAFVGFPFLNKALVKRFEKRDVYEINN